MDVESASSRTTPADRVVPLERAHVAGGKARGLAELVALGLPVPKGFAVLDAHLGVDSSAVEQAWRQLAVPAVAVRSSADVEDGVDRSFAGQFVTTLDVREASDVLKAIEACVASRAAGPAQAYAAAEQARMHVVVQQMVPARVAGVLFTADPVTGRRDRLVVEAVRGTGDALVSGRERAERYVLDGAGTLVSSQLLGDAPLLDGPTLQKLAREAQHAATAFGRPLDLEWAIDEAGLHAWLQARPITTLVDGDVALDSPHYADHVYTRSNVGEMLPGVVTPLTLSIFIESLNKSLFLLSNAVGVEPERLPLEPHIASYDGQLYFDLTRLYAMGTGMLGGSKSAVDLSIVGRVLDIGTPPAPPPFLRKLMNGVRYAKVLRAAPKRVDAMALAPDFAEPLPLDGTPAAIAAWFARAIAWVDEGWDVHMWSSTVAGSACAALLQTLSNRAPPQPEHFAAVAGMLEGVDDAESARLLRDVLKLADAVRTDATGGPLLAGTDDAALRVWLERAAPAEIGEAWRRLLAEHGHRSIREAELRSFEWAKDPAELFALMRTARAEDTIERAPSPVTMKVPLGARIALKFLLPMARAGVARRERSKSLAVRRQVMLRNAYGALGEKLASAGRLLTADHVFFLTHDELMQLVASETPRLTSLAKARRVRFDERQGERMPELTLGRPEIEALPSGVTTDLSGTPVCRGIVRGPVRVATTFAEAQALVPGEILVVPHIDVGWTPFFRVAKAVVTEIGSPLSHAAVVAREYGIPTVVNVSDATRRLVTGTVVEIDGARGTIHVVA